MILINIIALALSVWRITEMFTTQDGPFSIFKRLRTRLKVLQCPFCFSVWASVIGLIFYRYWPMGNYVFALSWSYGFSSLFSRRMATWANDGKKKEAIKELLIGQSANGQVSVIRSDFTDTEHLHIFNGFTNALMQNQKTPAQNENAAPN